MACICLLGMFDIIASDFESEEDKGYENQILSIEEFDTPHATKIIISFEHSNPVCTYNPESFEESTDDTIYRAFMPNTGVASDVVCKINDGDDDLSQEDTSTPFDCDSSQAGVELVLYGESITKFMGKDHIVFVVKK